MTNDENTIIHLNHQLAHWKANHADMVRRCAYLSQRPDLPVDRIPAAMRAEEEIRLLRRRIHNLERWIEDYCPPPAAADQDPAG
jgi:hypothetical protein